MYAVAAGFRVSVCTRFPRHLDSLGCSHAFPPTNEDADLLEKNSGGSLVCTQHILRSSGELHRPFDLKFWHATHVHLHVTEILRFSVYICLRKLPHRLKAAFSRSESLY